MSVNDIFLGRRHYQMNVIKSSEKTSREILQTENVGKKN